MKDRQKEEVLPFKLEFEGEEEDEEEEPQEADESEGDNTTVEEPIEGVSISWGSLEIQLRSSKVSVVELCKEARKLFQFVSERGIEYNRRLAEIQNGNVNYCR